MKACGRPTSGFSPALQLSQRDLLLLNSTSFPMGKQQLASCRKGRNAPCPLGPCLAHRQCSLLCLAGETPSTLLSHMQALGFPSFFALFQLLLFCAGPGACPALITPKGDAPTHQNSQEGEKKRAAMKETSPLQLSSEAEAKLQQGRKPYSLPAMSCISSAHVKSHSMQQDCSRSPGATSRGRLHSYEL